MIQSGCNSKVKRIWTHEFIVKRYSTYKWKYSYKPIHNGGISEDFFNYINTRVQKNYNYTGAPVTGPCAVDVRYRA